jgi:hypothetical protein
MRNSASARALVAVFASAAFLWTLVLSVSPELHERVHPDANKINHSCAVTLIASGNCNHPPAGPLVKAPAPTVELFQSLELNSVWVQSVFLSAHLFAHAPPVIA